MPRRRAFLCASFQGADRTGSGRGTGGCGQGQRASCLARVDVRMPEPDTGRPWPGLFWVRFDRLKNCLLHRSIVPWILLSAAICLVALVAPSSDKSFFTPLLRGAGRRKG